MMRRGRRLVPYREGLAPLKVYTIIRLLLLIARIFPGAEHRGHRFTGCFRLIPAIQLKGSFPVRHALYEKIILLERK
jgi:hypothetical protein